MHALHSEMWGIYLGLEMAWQEYIMQLIVEVILKS